MGSFLQGLHLEGPSCLLSLTAPAHPAFVFLLPTVADGPLLLSLRNAGVRIFSYLMGNTLAYKTVYLSPCGGPHSRTNVCFFPLVAK